MKIDGPTIQLTDFGVEDVNEDYVSWMNDSAVTKYLESRFDTHTRSSLERYVTDMNNRADVKLFRVLDKATEIHVGNIKLAPIDYHHRRAEVGLLIGNRAYWGRGIATEAIRLLTEYAFDVLGLTKITAGCYATNIGSRRAFEKAGYVVEAQQVDHFIDAGGLLVDSLLLSRWAHR